MRETHKRVDSIESIFQTQTSLLLLLQDALFMKAIDAFGVCYCTDDMQ